MNSLEDHNAPLPASQPGLLRRLWRDPALKASLPLFLAFRLITAIIAFWVVSATPPKIDWGTQPIYSLHEVVFTTQGPLRAWLEPWYRWDTGWFIHVAYDGYQSNDGSIAFAPLYPLLIHLIAPLIGGDYLVAALLISNLCCLIAMILLYKLVAQDFNDRLARQVLLFLVLFPSAFYLLAGYTESLFLLLALGAWLAAKRQYYWLAGFLAFLAALTRLQGWVLGLPLAYIVYSNMLAPLRPAALDSPSPKSERGVGGEVNIPLTFLRRLPAVLGSLLGTAAYIIGIQLAGLGNVSDALAGQWHITAAAPWQTLFNAAQVVVQGKATPNDLGNIAMLIFLVVIAVYMLKTLKPDYWLYTWATLGFVLLRSAAIQFESIIRYALSLFPLFVAIALITRRNAPLQRALRLGYVAIAGSLQIILLTLFVKWLWVA